MKIFAFFLVAIAVVTLAIWATPPQASAAPSSVEVKIDNFTFAPQALKVHPGTTVRWVNGDDIPHNVVAEDKTFRSKAMDTDDQFSFTFEKPGTYAYFCGLHPKMKGTITVE